MRDQASKSRNAELSPREVVLLAVWFAMLTGYIELGQLGYERFVRGQFLFLPKDVLWLTPVINSVFFLLAALMLLALSRRWRSIISCRGAVGVYLFLAFSCLLLMYHRLHGVAALLLAAGLAVQLSRWLARRGPGLLRIVRRTVPAMAAVIGLTASGLHLSRLLMEQRALRGLPPSAAANQSNVLLIILDTVRALNLSLYGYGRPTTPHLDRWAKRGVRFEQALSTAPWTLPSHATLFTGRWPHELGVGYDEPLNDRYPTLAEVLRERGYVTGGFVANKKYCGWETGLQRGFVHYEDYRLALGEILRGSALSRAIISNDRLRNLLDWHQLPDRKDAREINERFLAWLNGSNGRPFFAFLNYFDAHGPYLPPAPYAYRFGPKRPRHNVGLWPQEKPWTAEAIQTELDAYDESIAYLDSRIGELLDTLERHGHLRNTIVVITSDHGEEFGEHGAMAHGHDLYRPSVHVPLILLYPARIPPEGSVSAPVSQRDVPATIMDLLGDDAGQFPGRSLTRLWNGTADSSATASDTLRSELQYAHNLPDRYAVSKGDMEAVVFGGLRYIRNGDGTEELYDFHRDPWERRNLTGQEDDQTVQRFREALKTPYQDPGGPGGGAARVQPGTAARR